MDLQSIGIYTRSDIQHHIRTQQFQELLTKMGTIQKQSIDQNLRKLAETAGFLDIYTHGYSRCFKDIKDHIYVNGEKYRPQDISPINIFSFENLKNERLAFLGWPYYILERLIIIYAMFSFFGFLVSLLKEIYNTCATHTQTQVSNPASVARILFAGFCGILSTSINKILLDAQINEYNKNYQQHKMHMIIHETTKIQHLLHHNYTLYIKTIRYLRTTNLQEYSHNRAHLFKP